MRNTKVSTESGCWLAPSAGSYNKTRVNNADEYYHVLAWAFANLSSPAVIKDYLEHAGRSKGKTERLEIAHRCHLPECFNPECLVCTNPAANSDMDGCRYGTLATCPHDKKPPYMKCIFRKPITIGETYCK